MPDNAALSLLVPRDIMLAYARRVRALRIQFGITQKELAQRLGVAEGTIKRFVQTGKSSSAPCRVSRWRGDDSTGSRTSSSSGCPAPALQTGKEAAILPAESEEEMRLTVYLNHYGLRREVGLLSEENNRVFFEYAPDGLKSGIGLSPVKLPLRAGVFEETSRVFDGLFGLFHDSLPDGRGGLLLDLKRRKRALFSFRTWRGTKNQ